MIINGMDYTVSKESPIHASFKEIKAPIGGRIAKILVNIGTEVRRNKFYLF
jgi:biotin carboxyl carrier protein